MRADDRPFSLGGRQLERTAGAATPAIEALLNDGFVAVLDGIFRHGGVSEKDCDQERHRACARNGSLGWHDAAPFGKASNLASAAAYRQFSEIVGQCLSLNFHRLDRLTPN